MLSALLLLLLPLGPGSAPPVAAVPGLHGPPQGTAARGASASPAPVFDPATGRWPAPAVRYPVTRVVDGDTLWVQRDGGLAKLRLLSVDTEERLLGSETLSATKPETVFGEECARWAEEFFAGLAENGEAPRVGLAFPNGVERDDVYGRLLSHVVLPDGTDYNLLLVRTGKSPYFNKYGNSRPLHQAFVAAQAEARAARRGIWDPATNAPATPGAPSARRPYGRLLPWWQARADAIERFHALAVEAPGRWIEAEDPAAVERAFAEGDPVELFGGIHRTFDEDDGALTVLFRAGSRDAEVRAVIPAAAKAAFLAGFDLVGANDTFRQNYVYARGHLSRGPRGYRIGAPSPAAWRFADPAYDDRAP